MAALKQELNYSAHLLGTCARIRMNKDVNGTTALMWAWYKNDFDMVHLLLHYGANIHARTRMAIRR